MTGASAEREPLLAEVRVEDGEAPDGRAPLPSLITEMKLQARMALPLAVGHITNWLLAVISLAFVGHVGRTELAAATLAQTLYNLCCKVMMAGMLGMLDTYASQAVGAGSYANLGSLWRQCVGWLLLHTLPVAAAFACVPAALAWLGQPAPLRALLRPYLLVLLPAVWTDAVYRPLNRILIAQRITAPQMWISCLVAALHAPTVRLLMHAMGGSYLAAALATVWSCLLSTALVAAYVKASGLAPRVWGAPHGLKLQPWRPFIRLSYASLAGVFVTFASLTVITVAAGSLPDATTALAAVAVSTSAYGIAVLFLTSLYQAACIRVGNGLGTGSGAMARLSARAAATLVPLIWLPLALLLALPASQDFLIACFAKDPEAALVRATRHLLWMQAGQLAFDGSQLVMFGMACGAGKQARCFQINLVSCWGVGLPTGLALGFWGGLGVEGLFAGLIVSAGVQSILYGALLLRMRWDEEAAAARARALAAQRAAAAAEPDNEP